MKRWLLVLLTVLLPLQLAWATVGDYCDDAHQVSNSQGQHHHAAVADADAEPGDASAAVDCGHCHGHSTAMPLTLELRGVPQLSPAPVALATVRATPPLKPRPERPQWQSLA